MMTSLLPGFKNGDADSRLGDLLKTLVDVWRTHTRKVCGNARGVVGEDVISVLSPYKNIFDAQGCECAANVQSPGRGERFFVPARN